MPGGSMPSVTNYLKNFTKTRLFFRSLAMGLHTRNTAFKRGIKKSLHDDYGGDCADHCGISFIIKIYYRRCDTWWSERVNTIWTENHMEENSVWFFLSF